MKLTVAMLIAVLAIAQGFVLPAAQRAGSSLRAEAEPKKAANASFSYMDNLNTQTQKKAEEVAEKTKEASGEVEDKAKKTANASFSYMNDLNAKTAEAAESVKEGVEDAVEEVAAAGKKAGHYLDK